MSPCGKKIENGIIPHDFRRTFKTNFVQAGIDPAWRNALLGHSQSGMDAHYIGPNEEGLQRAMDRYTRRLDGEMERSSGQSSGQTIKDIDIIMDKFILYKHPMRIDNNFLIC